MAPEPQRLQLPVLVVVGAGGAFGSVARYWVGVWLAAGDGGFPLATWLVNVSGALVLAVVMTLVVERWPPTRYARPFAAIGLCGGYTTWSTFMTDAALLARGGHTATMVWYLAATVGGGLAATVAGVWLGSLWPDRTGRGAI